MKDNFIESLISQSQAIILRQNFITSDEILNFDDNFIELREWGEDEDGDDTIEYNLYKWDYAHMSLVPYEK